MDIGCSYRGRGGGQFPAPTKQLTLSVTPGSRTLHPHINIHVCKTGKVMKRETVVV